MRVVFSSSFKKDVSSLGKSIEITKQSIGTYHTPVNDLNLLFQDSYIGGDLDLLTGLPFQIISDNDGQIRLSIFCNSEEKKINIAAVNYSILYCYYKCPGEEEKLGFIIINPEISSHISGDNYALRSIGIHTERTLYLIEVPNQKTPIFGPLFEDTEFLEGSGITSGINFYLAGEESSLVSKKSFLDFYLNSLSEHSRSFNKPHLSSLGGQVDTEFVYRRVNSITLRTAGSRLEGDKWIDDTLDTDGGVLQYWGDINYTDYRVLENSIIPLNSGTTSLFDFPEIQTLVEPGFGEMGITIKETGRRIKYSKNNIPNKISWAKLQVKLKTYDLFEDKVIELGSNKVILRQGVGDLSWTLHTMTPFFEDIEGPVNLPVYLFSHRKDEEKTFLISYTDETILGRISISAEENGLDYFSIKVDTDKLKEKKLIEVKITTKQENRSLTQWNPIVNGVSKLLKFSIAVGRVYEDFYCIQSKLIKKRFSVKTKNSNSEIVNVSKILLPNSLTESTDLYVASGDEIENLNKWKAGNPKSTVNIVPAVGDLLGMDSSTWSTGPASVKISTTEINPLGQEVPLSSTVFIRLSEENTSLINPTNWRDVINHPIVVLETFLKPHPVDIGTNLPENLLILQEYGIYPVHITTNASFKAIVVNDGVEKRFALYKPSTKETLEEIIFPNITESQQTVTIYVRTLLTHFDLAESSEFFMMQALGKIKLVSVDPSISSSSSPFSLSAQQEYLEIFVGQDTSVSPNFRKLDPNRINVFTKPAFDSPTGFKNTLRYEGKVSSKVKTRKQTLPIEVVDNKVNLSLTEGNSIGYVDHETTYRVNGAATGRFPVVLVGEINITNNSLTSDMLGEISVDNPILDSGNNLTTDKRLHYWIYQLGVPVEVLLDNPNDSQVFLTKKGNGKYVLEFSSMYDNLQYIASINPSNPFEYRIVKKPDLSSLGQGFQANSRAKGLSSLGSNGVSNLSGLSSSTSVLSHGSNLGGISSSQSIFSKPRPFRYTLTITYKGKIYPAETLKIGNIKIWSRINGMDGFFGRQNYHGEALSQDEIDEIAGVSEINIDVNLLGTNHSYYTLGSFSKISGQGEHRSYSIYGKSPGDKFNVINIHATEGPTNYLNQSAWSFTSTWKPRFLDRNPLSETNLNLWKNFAIEDASKGFSVLVTNSGSSVWTSTYPITQSGFRNGIVYSDLSTTVLFIGDSSTYTQNKVTKNVDAGADFVDLMIGNYYLPDINPTSVGKSVRVEDFTPIGNTTGSEVIVLSESSNLTSTNVRIRFPRNTGSEPIIRKFLVSSGESSFVLVINHGGVVYTINPGEIPHGARIPFHSSGSCIIKGLSKIGILTENLETNIPEDKLRVVLGNSIADNNPVEVESVFTNTGAGTSPGLDNYKVTVRIPANKGASVINGTKYLSIGYKNVDTNKFVYIRNCTWQIKQGVTSLYLIHRQSNILIYNNGSLGSEHDPVVSPPENSGTDLDRRHIFSIGILCYEFTGPNGQSNAIQINKTTNVLLENDKTRWSLVNAAPGTNLSDVFSQNSTVIVQSESHIPSNYFPFLENKYNVKNEFISTTVGFKVDASLKVLHPEINSYITDFKYTFNFLKNSSKGSGEGK